MLRASLALLLLLILGGGIAATVRYWTWLDARRLAGVAIVGLAFFAIAILGINLQLGEDFRGQNEPLKMVRRFLRYTGQIVIFLAIFLDGIWALLSGITHLLSPILPDWLVGLIYVIAFTWYIAGVIKVLSWLAERRIIGG